jgi:hypothetical protein
MDENILKPCSQHMWTFLSFIELLLLLLLLSILSIDHEEALLSVLSEGHKVEWILAPDEESLVSSFIDGYRSSPLGLGFRAEVDGDLPDRQSICLVMVLFNSLVVSPGRNKFP